jgi:hypothetical protein
MTLTHPGSAGTVRSSHSAHQGALERGFPASLSAMVAEQRTADLIRATELAPSWSPRGDTAGVKARGAVGTVRLALGRALTPYRPRGTRRRRSARGGAPLTGSTSRVVCCA